MFKKIFGFFMILFFLPLMAGERNTVNIVGDYEGKLDMGAVKLRLIFHINMEEGKYKASVDSIDQGANGIPVSEVNIDGKVLKLTLPMINAVYTGTFKDDVTVDGKWVQGGQSFPLTIVKTEKPSKVLRFQEPKKPYPYESEEVYFINKKENVKLAGTFTYPKKEGKYPAVVLITGSGPQNRNEELMGHKPFLVLSDFLTKNNMAVLRFDDRGVAESGGVFGTANSFDFAKDVEAAIDYLKSRKEVNSAKIGLIGHSEGGLIAPIVASTSNDVNFIVMIAGPSVSGDKILIAQNELILKSMGMDESSLNKYLKEMRIEFDSLLGNKDKTVAKDDLIKNSTKFFKENFTKDDEKFGMTEENIKKRAEIYSSNWFSTFLEIDPCDYLLKVKVPILALYGEKDMQVPPSLNVDKAKEALKKAGNKKSTVVVVDSCNHLFQTCKTGTLAEYSQIDETISPKVLNIILKWCGDVIKE